MGRYRAAENSINYEKDVAVCTTRRALHQTVIQCIPRKLSIIMQFKLFEDAVAVGADGVNA